MHSNFTQPLAWKWPIRRDSESSALNSRLLLEMGHFHRHNRERVGSREHPVQNKVLLTVDESTDSRCRIAPRRAESALQPEIPCQAAPVAA